MASLDKFAANMAKTARTVERAGPRIQRATATRALQAVVLATPVGNPALWQSQSKPAGYVGGRARANWLVGLGAAQTGTTDARDKGGQSTIQQGKSTIGSSVPGQPIHLTNNLPYIVPLNDGHSTQAPAGFVEQAVHAAVQSIRESKIFQE